MSFLSVALCSSHFGAVARGAGIDAACANDTESSQNKTTQLALISIRGGDETRLMLGANLPVAAGLGYTFKMEKTDHVVIAYFGEGASNVGDFHEALNFAGVQQLPVIFICENNQYAYSVPVEKSMAIDDVAIRAEGYGFDGVAINGNDVLAVYQATQGALARARAGDGPTLIECKTYRWHGHSEHDKAFYRTDEELAMWKSRDPIPTFTTYLRARHVLDDQKQQDIEAKVAATIDDALEFAMNSPDPQPGEAVTDLYA